MESHVPADKEEYGAFGNRLGIPCSGWENSCLQSAYRVSSVVLSHFSWLGGNFQLMNVSWHRSE